MFSAVDTEVKTMGWKMQSFPWKKFCWIWPISFDMHQESYFHGRLRISQLLWHVAFRFIWRLERNDTPGQWSQSECAPIEIKDASFFVKLHRNPWLTHCVFVLTPQGFISVFLRCVCILSLFSRVRLFATLWTVAHQAPLSMGFSRQEYWSALPCPPPGDLLDPGIKPVSPALQVDSLLSELRYSINVC